MITHYIVVGLGGALGSIFRVALSTILPSSVMGIPLQIMMINLLGCFTIGILSELINLHWSAADNIKYFLIPGFLGGFTTFSSFALEFGSLFEKDKFMLAFTYVILSVVLGLSMFFVGVKLIKICMPITPVTSQIK